MNKEEKKELLRIIDGGEYSEVFWRTRWSEARQPSEEELLRKELSEIPQETIQDKRSARKIVKKLKKLAGRKRAFSTAGYSQNWNEEQKRLDNLQNAAIYISRANSGFHFYA